MSSRRVEFVRGRVLATPQEVYDTWVRTSPTFFVQGEPHTVPPEYALGTVQHESDYALDEVDTEPSGFQSKGIFQVSTEEAIQAGLPDSDLLDLEQATEVMTRISVERVNKMLAAAKVQVVSSDVWAMLSVAHNQGLAAALKSINSHGLDWAQYKYRNLDHVTRWLANATSDEERKAATQKLNWWRSVFAYGDDCVTGGSRWHEVTKR